MGTLSISEVTATHLKIRYPYMKLMPSMGIIFQCAAVTCQGWETTVLFDKMLPGILLRHLSNFKLILSFYHTNLSLQNFQSFHPTLYWACDYFSILGLTHCGLVTPYGDKELCQHWLRWWLVAWWHQAIAWTNVDLSSVRFSEFHPGGIFIHQSLKWASLNFLPNLPGDSQNCFR